MSRWIALGITALTLAWLMDVSDAEARGRRGGYCANCQYSMPTVTLPAAQAPAPPADAVTEAAPETAPLVSSETSRNHNTYTQNVSTRRGRWFGRYRG
ncbi:MAG TPA: hypothetical protein VMM76_18175 [Pirellulaceae bacterium]|nr:hypothetical protein [Pirellulaceae bacterium]